ncbi:MAG: tetratricopeptide repeat protein [Candidatus Omnitrophica bacterium]|nr:tetratricopeptide repeat protein [Candidatus Omnitrophota bacterium]
MAKKAATSVLGRHKILLAAFGVLLSLILLELGMRIGAQAILYAQGLKNMIAAQRQGACRILCLGESTTALGGADAYPAQLEQILNSSGSGKEFTVLNAGIVAAHTQTIVSQLEGRLDKYRPDMVIVMMGINDGYDRNIPYVNGRGLRRRLRDFIMSLKTVKLARSINMSIRAPSVKTTDCGKYASEDKGYFEQALLYRHQGKFIEAAELFRKALSFNPMNDMVYLELGCTYIFQGDYAAAQKILQEGMALSPGNDSMYYWFGVLCMEQGKHLSAEEFFSKAARINPLNDRAYGGLGTLYGSLNRKDDSRISYDMADKARLDYYNPSTRNNFLRIKKITGDRGIKLICAQYPMHSVESLKRIFSGDDGNIVFVDNSRIFKEAVGKEGYPAYFTDMFAGDFGHCTARGNRLLAQNIADTILIINK